uniref:Uncharacterized protein n=1 Tax=Steinernema glaseri TaxID=37863 RepID=A0A1I8AKT0_9BILA
MRRRQPKPPSCTKPCKASGSSFWQSVPLLNYVVSVVRNSDDARTSSVDNDDEQLERPIFDDLVTKNNPSGRKKEPNARDCINEKNSPVFPHKHRASVRKFIWIFHHVVREMYSKEGQLRRIEDMDVESPKKHTLKTIRLNNDCPEIGRWKPTIRSVDEYYYEESPQQSTVLTVV